MVLRGDSRRLTVPGKAKTLPRVTRSKVTVRGKPGRLEAKLSPRTVGAQVTCCLTGTTAPPRRPAGYVAADLARGDPNRESQVQIAGVSLLAPTRIVSGYCRGHALELGQESRDRWRMQLPGGIPAADH